MVLEGSSHVVALGILNSYKILEPAARVQIVCVCVCVCVCGLCVSVGYVWVCVGYLCV